MADYRIHFVDKPETDKKYRFWAETVVNGKTVSACGETWADAEKSLVAELKAREAVMTPPPPKTITI